jgi:hypothetical protein
MMKSSKLPLGKRTPLKRIDEIDNLELTRLKDDKKKLNDLIEFYKTKNGDLQMKLNK